MKRSLFIFSVLSAAITLQSCKSHFRISVKEPSQVNMPDSITNFGLVSNVNKETSPEQILGQIMGVESINGNIVAGDRALNGILRAFDNSGYIKGEILTVGDSIRFEDGSLNWTYIDSMSKAKSINGLIEIEKVQTTTPVGGSVLANASGQTSTKLNGTMVVNFYVAESHQKFERFTVYHSYTIPLSGNRTIIDILNDEKKKQEYFKALGFQLGYKAGALIYPNWVWVNRTYYNKGTKALKRAKPMIREGNWDIAEKQLMYDIYHRSDKKRGRVLFNLALVKEGQGYIDEAISYAEQSALECGNKEANEYLKTLRNRKRQLEIIDFED